jgi:hypothetical protein
MRAKFGVDIGGVIIDGHVGRGEEGFFDANHLRTPQMYGGFAALRRIKSSRHVCSVYVVSTARPPVEKKLREWLEANRFHEETGISPSDVHFCAERSQKAFIGTILGLTHFIDDRLQVLGSMDRVAHRYLFRPRPEEVERYGYLNSKTITRVESWDDFMARFQDLASDKATGLRCFSRCSPIGR